MTSEGSDKLRRIGAVRREREQFDGRISRGRGQPGTIVIDLSIIHKVSVPSIHRCRGRGHRVRQGSTIGGVGVGVGVGGSGWKISHGRHFGRLLEAGLGGCKG